MIFGKSVVDTQLHWLKNEQQKPINGATYTFQVFSLTTLNNLSDVSTNKHKNMPTGISYFKQVIVGNKNEWNI